MSGYNPSTGVFELTATKAGYWLRRSDLPPSCDKTAGMEFYAALLRHFGHDVIKTGSSYLHVHATPGQVWEALSGQPSDPEHEKHYTRNPAPGAVTTSAPREGVRLLPASAITLFRSRLDGSGQPIAEAIATGRGACRICGKPIAKGTECMHGDYDFSNGRNGPKPTKCYVHRECLNQGSA